MRGMLSVRDGSSSLFSSIDFTKGSVHNSAIAWESAFIKTTGIISENSFNIVASPEKDASFVLKSAFLLEIRVRCSFSLSLFKFPSGVKGTSSTTRISISPFSWALAINSWHTGGSWVSPSGGCICTAKDIDEKKTKINIRNIFWNFIGNMLVTSYIIEIYRTILL